MYYDIVLIRPLYNLLDSNYNEHTNLDKRMKTELYPPLGLCYLKSSLQKQNLKAKIIDSFDELLDNDKIISFLIKDDVNIVGIYVNSFNLPYVRMLIDKIRKNLRAYIILGGPHITYYPQSVKKLKADFGIRGDGENVLPKLVNYLNYHKGSLKSIKGLVYKNSNSNYDSKNINYINNLDSLPYPDLSDIHHLDYFFPLYNKKTITMITSRGCPFNCLSCALPHKEIYHERSIENIIGEIKKYLIMGYKYIDFKDDIFTFNKKRVEKLCNYIINNKIKFEWGCETRIDFMDYSLMRLMKKAGCRNIKFGIESGSDRIRKIIGKDLNEKRILNIFTLLKREKIESVVYFILGHPSETITEMKETIHFIDKIKPDYIDIVLNIPIPGSRLFNIAVKEGLITEDIWDEVIDEAEIPVYIPQGVKLSEMRKLQREVYKKFYFNPYFMFTNLLNARSFKEIRQKIMISYTIFNKFVRSEN